MHSLRLFDYCSEMNFKSVESVKFFFSVDEPEEESFFETESETELEPEISFSALFLHEARTKTESKIKTEIKINLFIFIVTPKYN